MIQLYKQEKDVLRKPKMTLTLNPNPTPHPTHRHAHITCKRYNNLKHINSTRTPVGRSGIYRYKYWYCIHCITRVPGRHHTIPYRNNTSCVLVCLQHEHQQYRYLFSTGGWGWQQAATHVVTSLCRDLEATRAQWFPSSLPYSHGHTRA